MPGIPPIADYPLPTANDLPRNIVAWKPCPERAVLLIHDMQGYFLAPFPDTLRADLVRTVAGLRSRCAALGVPVAYTAQPGSMTTQDRGLLGDFWGPGMRTATSDRAIVQQLAPTDDDWIFTKWRYSAFFRSDLRERMLRLGRDQLILCGVYAHVGVQTTALEAFSYDIQPFLVADAIADFSKIEG